MERGFNACQTHRSMYPSIFNRFPVIQPVSWKVRHFSTFFAHFGLPWLRPWDNRGKFTRLEKGFNHSMLVKCLAAAHISICLQPFLRYSKLLVENRDIFIPHLCLAPPQGVTPRRNFLKMFDAGKTRMIGLPYGEQNYDDMLSHLSAWHEQTDGRTDGQNCYINIARQHQCADAR